MLIEQWQPGPPSAWPREDFLTEVPNRSPSACPNQVNIQFVRGAKRRPLVLENKQDLCYWNIPRTAHGLNSATSQALKAKLEAKLMDVKGVLEKLVAQSL